ncbi:MAG: hypothetical protein HYS65_17010 [Betaproteobacteria bacterium]|nr:hypothetical protein [Betaproteobacteria bacterium]
MAVGLGKVPDERAQIVDAVESEPHEDRQGAVAAAIAPGRFLQHANTRRLLQRRQGGRTRCVAGPDDQNIIMKSLFRQLRLL